MDTPNALPAPDPQKKDDEPQHHSHVGNFLLRILRLVVFGSAIIYTAFTVLPEGIFPSLNTFHIALIALGGSLLVGLLVFIVATPGRESVVSSSFDVEAMAGVLVGMLTILALSIVSLFDSGGTRPDIIFWLLLVGVYTFYVFMIIRRGLALQNENEELKQKYGELLELDEEKTDFVTVTSHQLRTPLNEIKWILGFAVEQEMSAQAKEALQKGLFATNRMVDIVNSLLRARTLDLNTDVLEHKEINLGELIGRIVEREQEFAREKNVGLTYYPPESAVILHGAQEELGMAVENVIDNAIRYSPNATVTVTLQPMRQTTQVRIEDTGMGIAPEDRERIFRKFYRAQNALKLQPDGTGIGLFTTKKIVEKHGGSITFVSELGKGTKFLITLPINQK